MPRTSVPRPRRRPIEQYDHQDKTRSNNPPAGLVDAQNNPDLEWSKRKIAALAPTEGGGWSCGMDKA